MQVKCLVKDSVAFTLFPTTLDKGVSEVVKVLYLGLILEYEVNMYNWSMTPGILLTSMLKQLGEGQDQS